MEVNTAEFEQYIGSVVSSIQRATNVNGSKVVGNIKFDLAVTNTEGGGGGLKLYIVSAEGSSKTETLSRIVFEVDPNHASNMEALRLAAASPLRTPQSYR